MVFFPLVMLLPEVVLVVPALVTVLVDVVLVVTELVTVLPEVVPVVPEPVTVLPDVTVVLDVTVVGASGEAADIVLTLVDCWLGDKAPETTVSRTSVG